MDRAESSHQEFLDKFPPIEEYKQSIEKFKRLDFSNLSQLEIGEQFYKHCIVNPVSVGIFDQNDINDTTFYRVRKIQQGAEDMKMIRTFSYPPTNLCSKNGRANVKGTNVFYASDYAYTAMAECKNEPGEYGYLSIWKPIFDRSVNVAVILPENLREENVHRETAINMHKYAQEQLYYLGREKKEQVDVLMKFVCEYFMEEKSPYYITSWLANSLLYAPNASDVIDILIYPSVNTEALFCNFAINPNIADTYLRLDKIFMFRYSDCSVGYIGKMHGSFIMWSKPLESEANEFFEAVGKAFQGKK
jgi:hypothetical protein